MSIEFLYLDKIKSAIYISKKLNKSVKEVRKYIRDNDLKKKRDVLFKKKLSKLYLNQGHSISDLSDYFGLSKASVSNYLKKYDIKKSKDQIESEASEKRKKTCLDRYGCDSPLKSKEVQDKIKKTNLEKYSKDAGGYRKVIEKRKNTNLGKYGVENPMHSPEIKERLEKTNLERYGYRSVLSDPVIRKKIRQTNLLKYGKEVSASSDRVRKKMKKTFQDKYGEDYPFESSAIQKKARKTINDKYGVNYFSQSNSYKKARIDSGNMHCICGKTIRDISQDTGLNMSLIRHVILKSNMNEESLLKYIYSYEKKLTNIENAIKDNLQLPLYNKHFDSTRYESLKYRPDFKLNKNVALNVDGLYWHSELKKSNKWYHFNMRRDYEELGLRIFQFRADEVNYKLPIIKSMLNNLSNKSSRIFARKTVIRKVLNADASKFLKENHLMGSIRARHLGLFYNNELVSIMSYKSIKNNLKIERFCTKLGCIVVGGRSKLLKYIETKEKHSSVHYWVDLRYGTGASIVNQGFVFEKDTLGWKWTDFNKTYNRLRCRANMDSRGLSEKEHAEELGWYKIYDAGQRLYVKYS